MRVFIAFFCTTFIYFAILHDIKCETIGNNNYLSNDKHCGIINIEQSYVKGGQKVQRGKWPWLVAIKHDNEFICGGVLISKHQVLTGLIINEFILINKRIFL